MVDCSGEQGCFYHSEEESDSQKTFVAFYTSDCSRYTGPNESAATKVETGTD